MSTPLSSSRPTLPGHSPSASQGGLPAGWPWPVRLASRWLGGLHAGLDALRPLAALAARLWVAQVFFLAGLTKLLANEWAAKGINVNAVAPGYIATSNTQALRADPASTLYVGDSNVDVETAHNANLPCCGAVWGFRTREELNAAGAEYLAENSDELYDVIMK